MWASTYNKFVSRFSLSFQGGLQLCLTFSNVFVAFLWPSTLGRVRYRLSYDSPYSPRASTLRYCTKIIIVCISLHIYLGIRLLPSADQAVHHRATRHSGICNVHLVQGYRHQLPPRAIRGLLLRCHDR